MQPEWGSVMTPLEFDWDDGNQDHIARHNVATDEAEQVVTGPHVILRFQDRSGEFRRLIVGRTAAGRPLSITYVMRGGRIRVVTAHTAKEKWRRVLDQRGL
jgi:uncharacterized DUF497 family protein